MPGPTLCPFCRSSNIGRKPSLDDLRTFHCRDCDQTWLVARAKRQAKIVEFPDAAARARRRASGEGR